MKNKILKIVLGIVLILAVVGLVYASKTLNKKNDELDSHLVELNYSQLKEKLDNNDDFILLITKTTCTHCESFKPRFKDILSRYNITAYEIALDKLSDDEKKVFNEVANVSGTPTTIFIKNGSEATTTNRLVGDIQDEDTIITRLKTLGYIKE